MLKRLLLSSLLLLLILITVVLIKTFTKPSKQVNSGYEASFPLSDSSIRHMQQAIRFKTVSYNDTNKIDTSQFGSFQRYLQIAYPLIHQKLRLEKINQYALLYTWEGENPSLAPIVLMAHQDVVPVEEATISQWKADPFGGIVKDGYIWGRGAIDDKGSMISILEAAEKLLSQGYEPPATILLVFGDDEERSGYNGKAGKKSSAEAIVHLLKQRHVKPAFVLDEGGIITKNKVPGMKKPVALIGTTEKGYLSVELSVNIPGGHSSMPEKETSITVLCKAITRLQEHQFDARFTQPIIDLMDHLGPEMPFFQRMAFANRWLFGPVIKSIYKKSPGGNTK